MKIRSCQLASSYWVEHNIRVLRVTDSWLRLHKLPDCYLLVAVAARISEIKVCHYFD
jgi:hypothetical protein